MLAIWKENFVLELPLRYQRAVRNYQSIQIGGLTLFPVRVKEYAQWCMARPAVEALQQAFPARLMRVPLLAAMYRLDFERRVNGEEISGLFFRALLALSLSLRLGEGLEPEERIKRFLVKTDRKDPAKLMEVRWRRDGEEDVTVTPAQFQKLRPIMAGQNGVKLYGDDANPELVEAERQMAELSGPKLDAEIDDMICSVAALTGAEETDIDEWALLKLLRRAEALKRAMDYIVCGVGQTQGTTWKGGNPAPHPFFNRVREGSAAVVSVEEFGKNPAMREANAGGRS